MAHTKYGSLPNKVVISYLHRLVGRVYKLIPMKEEGCSTLDIYIDNLLRELINTHELVNSLQDEGEFLNLLGTLHGLAKTDIEENAYKSDAFKCLNIIKKIIANLEGGR